MHGSTGNYCIDIAMINKDESALAKYNVILGMHRAAKWSEIPTD